VALDQLGPLPDRHAPLRGDRDHAEPWRADRGRAAHHGAAGDDGRRPAGEFGVNASDREAEWPADEIDLPLPRPGGRINIGRESGALFVTRGESGIAEHMSPAFAAMLD
jgi:hypothetical protein